MYLILYFLKRNVHQLNLSYNCSAYFDEPDLTPTANGNSYIFISCIENPNIRILTFAL